MGKVWNKLGGRGRTSQIEKWKETTWLLTLQPNKIVSKTKKRKAENIFIQDQVKKIARLQENLENYQAANSKLEKAEKENKQLATTLGPKITKHNKSWSQYRSKQKKQIANDVCTALKFTEKTHFRLKNIHMQNIETNEMLSIHQDGSTTSIKPQLSENKGTVIKQTLYVKERFNISDEAYHELCMVHPSLPRWSTLNKTSKDMSCNSAIFAIPGPIVGVQQSLKSRLTIRLQQMVKINPSLVNESSINVKITGDGTQVSRSMHILVLAFTILDGNANPNSPSGNHTIAMLNAQEKYEHLSHAVKDIANEIESIQSITIDGHEFNIQFFLGADMKFLAICLGIQAANAKYSCIWCKCPAGERYDISKSWCSIEDGKRTVAEIQTLALANKKAKYGCIHQPLFPSISIDRVIPDILHLFLRISDVLINLLILDLRRMDGIEKLKNNEFNQTATQQLVTYITYLNQCCKIPFHMYTDKDSKILKWRDLTGPEKLKLFKAIKIPELFPRLINANDIQILWDTFKQMYELLWSSKNMDEQEIKGFTKKATSWITLFTSIYQTKNVTPYMHVLVAHVPQLLKDFGSLAKFSQQGLEKLNDEITKAYFKSTNHRNEEALKQIMLKLNRLEELIDQQHFRTKQTHICSTCKEIGHNKRTCPH